LVRLSKWQWFRKPPDEFVHDGLPLGADVEWAAFPWPDPGTYDRRQILSALRAVVAPHPKDWADAGTLVRLAVGNDHRGTVYPAAVAMTEKLLTVAESYPGDPRWVALTVLESWWGGYETEVGFTSYVGADGSRLGVIPEIARRIVDAAALLTRIAEEVSEPANAALASALLTVIPLGWGHVVDEHGVVHSWGGRVDPDGSVHFPGTDNA
jgi:hypothetical protein